ncbi:sodium/glutamate symporter [Sphingobium yanoikuyae]|uniref:Sodium/glutamate symporter n=2 Tax=Sphingomonadaceae TaxID=41297 RepID=A0A6M4GDE3_SPHYA|nr:sodium/glutamate symporter [Sphingobium yanoikuyae]
MLYIDALTTSTIAILLLFAGKALVSRFDLFKRYSIPEPVIGGIVCAAVVSGIYLLHGSKIEFDIGIRDTLLLYFFAAIGLNSDVRTIRSGGWALIILTALASLFILLQNLLAMTIASAFGLDPRAGLMVGSISLTGGIGTTLAWAPHFVETLGIANAAEIGTAGNMFGLIAACLIGGPVAGYLIRARNIPVSGASMLEIGTLHEPQRTLLDYYGALLALFWLNVTLLLGQSLTLAIKSSGLNLPDFVGCLLAGIILRGVTPHLTTRKRRLWDWPRMQRGVALISEISLGIFITMALMSLQLWALDGMVAFLAVALCLQITMAIAFMIFILFPCLGRDYEAAVMSAGFGGIGLGSTATAIANMSAVTRQYGAAPKAFIVVPLVCGFFIDLANAILVGIMI